VITIWDRLVGVKILVTSCSEPVSKNRDKDTATTAHRAKHCDQPYCTSVILKPDGKHQNGMRNIASGARKIMEIQLNIITSIKSSAAPCISL
jgi:hypothetical protein